MPITVRKIQKPSILMVAPRGMEKFATFGEIPSFSVQMRRFVGMAAELEENVFPALPDYDMTAAAENNAVTVTVDSDHFVVGWAALLRYFDESLLNFQRSP